MKLINLKVTLDYSRKIRISWEYKHIDVDLSTSYIKIYRSDNPSSNLNDYTLVVDNLSANNIEYIDEVKNISDTQKIWYYKVELITGNISSIYPEYYPASFIDGTNNIAVEIIRRKNLSLRIVGRDYKLLKKRESAGYCPDCWDPVLFRSLDPNCPTCLGTGHISGYYSPISGLAEFTVSPKMNQITMFGEWKPGSCLMYTTNYPSISVNDIIVDDKSNRWTVNVVRTIESKGVVVEQQAQLTLISTDDVVYDYQIN